MEQNHPDQPPETQSVSKPPPTLSPESSRAFAELARTLADSGMSVVVTERFSSGPLPSPETLEKYQQVSAEALALILREYAAEGPHRRQHEQTIIRDRILMARLGLVAAFFITVLFLSAGFYLILQGHDAAGAAICGAGLVSVVVAFLRHTASQGRK